MKNICRLPDEVEMDEIMYQLYVLDKIRKGQNVAKEGHTISSEALKREIDVG